MPNLTERVLDINIAIFYFCFSTLWIVFSDIFVSKFAQNVEDLFLFEVIKGFIFIFLSSVFIFQLNSKQKQRIRQKELDLQESKNAIDVQTEKISLIMNLLQENQKYSELGKFQVKLSHDLNNLLTLIGGQVENLDSNMKDGEMNEMKDNIISSLEVLSEFSQSIVHFSTDWGKENSNFSINALIQQYLPFYRAIVKPTVEIESYLTAEFSEVYGSKNKLNQILFNLVINANDAIQESGKISIVTRNTKSRLCLEIHDDGSGIPEEKHKYVFNPYFTTKENGNGLGLYIVKETMSEFQGNVQFISEPNHTTFQLCFPLFE